MKNKTGALFLISQWNNNIDWVHKYTDYYIVYDKSNTLEQDEHVFKCDNVGYNIFDMAHFIVGNYECLPDLVIFVEGDPWSHISLHKFNEVINNTCFTSLEDYSNIPESKNNRRDSDFGFIEFNDNWYLSTGNPKFTHQWYESYDVFMNDMFTNYKGLDWIRFAPGAQYIVPKKNILYYSRDFWSKIMGSVSYSIYPAEAMIIERALYYIFTNKYKERKPVKYE